MLRPLDLTHRAWPGNRGKSGPTRLATSYLARTLRLLVLLTLFVLGTGTHEEAMAQGQMAGSLMAQVHHHQAPSQWAAAKRCGASQAPCCVAGQCLLAVPCAAAIDFPAALRGTPAPLALPALAAIAPELPFRPPLTT